MAIFRDEIGRGLLMSDFSNDPGQTGPNPSQKYLALAIGLLPCVFLFTTSTTHLVQGEFVYDTKRLLQLLLLVILFSAAGFVPVLRHSFALQISRIPFWVRALLALVIVLGIVSSLVAATSPINAIYPLMEVALLSFLVLAVLVLAACRSVAGELFDSVVLTVVAVTAIAVGLQELTGVAATLASKLEFYTRISLMHYSFPRFYNQVQSWTLPVLAALPLVWSRSRSELLGSKWFQGVVCLSTLTLHWYIILMTGGRGVALSLTLSFVICVLFLPETRRSSLRWHLPGLLLGILLFYSIAQITEHTLSTGQAVLPHGGSEIAEPADTNPQIRRATQTNQFASQSLVGRLNLDSSGRLQLWRDSIQDIRSHPILGVGPMNYACTGPINRNGHPHSLVLQIAGEWGIPATLALLTIFVFLVISIWNSQRTEENPYRLQLGALLITGLVSAAAYSFLSGILVMPASQVAGILIGGWLLGLNPIKPSTRRVTVPHTILLISGFVICATMTVFSYHESKQREYREEIIPAFEREIPRYWQHGKICKYLDDFNQ
jgi:hypothetical protein